MSPEEKRELIQAHAAARAGRPSGYGLGYYIAVGASCLVVMTGWWLTLDDSLRWGGPKEADPLVAELRGEAEAFRESLDGRGADLKEDLESAKAAVEQAKRKIESAKAASSTQR